MPDIGGMELLVIGIVALIVVGPKDLPVMFKKLGQMVARVRAMGREFTNAMNDAADGTGMTEMNRDLRAASKFTNPKAMAKDFMGDIMDDIDPSKYEEGSATREVAEKKAKAQAEARERAAAARAARAERDAEAAELSAEPFVAPSAAPADVDASGVDAPEPAQQRPEPAQQRPEPAQQRPEPAQQRPEPAQQRLETAKPEPSAAPHAERERS